VKKVAVELGGKNPNIVFADADFETTVDYALTAVFLHSGQVWLGGRPADRCRTRSTTSSSPRSAAARSGSDLGNGLDPESESGPMVSAAHRSKIEAYVASAQEQGARLVAGGRRPDDPELQKGFFYRPTLFATATAR